MRVFNLFIILLLSGTICLGQHMIIRNVPDHSQPPTYFLPSTTDTTNYCAPFAFVNITDYWQNIQVHPYALNIMGGLSAIEASEYIGWFMDTNDQGSPGRRNGNPAFPAFPTAAGTYCIDQAEGMFEFADCDMMNPYGFPFPVPALKIGYPWEIIPHFINDFPAYMTEIDVGYPVKLDFRYWNILPTGDFVFDPGISDDTIFVYKWGNEINNSGFDPDAPFETWNLETGEQSIGHAVTGIGYLIDTLEFAVVHDNWAHTPVKIAIPWQDLNSINPNVSSMIFVHPKQNPDLTVSSVQSLQDSLTGFTDTLRFGQSVDLRYIVKNLTTFGVPSFILTTQVHDPDWILIAADTLLYTFSPNKILNDSINIFSDSVFTPQKSGDYTCTAHVFWDANSDSIINDAPDADPGNDVLAIQKHVSYHTVYSTFTLIPNVPDINQPPDVTLPSTIADNYCAPTAAVNITEYWDNVKIHNNAYGVNAGFAPETAAEYIGWFMDTNDMGNPNANNGTTNYPGAPGTYTIDQDSMLYYFIRWDTAHTYHPSAPSLPATKNGYDWIFNSDYNSTTNTGFPFYQSEIDAGRPAKADFLHWNIFFSGTMIVDTMTQDTVYIYNWGNPVFSSTDVDSAAPPEIWNLQEGFTGIGHAVTGVGYLFYGQNDSCYAIVHDNWPNTPQNIAIPWKFWNVTMAIDPGSPVVSVKEESTVIIKYNLQQNYPNPFNPVTTIQFQIAKNEFVKLRIYNMLGQKVATLISAEKPAGRYQVHWDARSCASGVYYYRFEAGQFSCTRKMVLLQ